MERWKIACTSYEEKEEEKEEEEERLFGVGFPLSLLLREKREERGWRRRGRMRIDRRKREKERVTRV